MKVCAISFKDCWRTTDGRWYSDGGFPLQMAAVASLFDAMDLLIVGVPPRQGGVPLPEVARIVPMESPRGEGWRRKLSVILGFRSYWTVLARHILKADVVHVPLPGDIPFLGMLIALAARKPLIARYCGSWKVNSRTTFMNRVTMCCIRAFAGGRNVMLVTGTRAETDKMNAVFATALSQAELECIHPVFDRRLSDPPRLIYAGRLSPEKGLTHLIEAVSMLQSSGFEPLPNVTIAGDGPERRRLEALARERGCAALFTFTGQLDRSSLSARLQDADFCVQPSLTEGFSKAWLDAMAHGMPVLATPVGSADEVIGPDGERGWLAKAGDTAALEATLRRVLAEPQDWPAIRRRCRLYAETRTLESWRHHIGEICAKQWSIPLVEGKLVYDNAAQTAPYSRGSARASERRPKGVV